MFCIFIRYGVPMMYLNLGQDDEAYNFIKFWLWETKKARDMHKKKCPGQFWVPYISFEDTVWPELI